MSPREGAILKGSNGGPIRSSVLASLVAADQALLGFGAAAASALAAVCGDRLKSGCNHHERGVQLRISRRDERLASTQFFAVLPSDAALRGMDHHIRPNGHLSALFERNPWYRMARLDDHRLCGAQPAQPCAISRHARSAGRQPRPAY